MAMPPLPLKSPLQHKWLSFTSQLNQIPHKPKPKLQFFSTWNNSQKSNLFSTGPLYSLSSLLRLRLFCLKSISGNYFTPYHAFGCAWKIWSNGQSFSLIVKSPTSAVKSITLSF